MSPQSKLVCITDEESLAAEKFRFLGVRLRHLQQKRPLKRMLVTSSVAGEGKSTVAANLACALAGRSSRRYCCWREICGGPRWRNSLGLGELPGLSELLEGESDQPTNIYQLESLGFWILPAGSPSRNPLEFMQPGKLSVLMDQLGAGFDWIVIDSPPVLPLADTSIWMRLADAILLVTRPGTTAKRQLQRSLEAIEQPSCWAQCSMVLKRRLPTTTTIITLVPLLRRLRACRQNKQFQPGLLFSIDHRFTCQSGIAWKFPSYAQSESVRCCARHEAPNLRRKS